MRVVEESVIFYDAMGKHGTIRFYVGGETVYAAQDAAVAILTTLPLLANATITNYRGAANASPSPGRGAKGFYQSIEDKAVFTFVSALGTSHHYQIPAPLQGLFDSTSARINVDHPAVQCFVRAMLEHACHLSGAPLQRCVGGKRTRVKAHRLNSFTDYWTRNINAPEGSHGPPRTAGTLPELDDRRTHADYTGG